MAETYAASQLGGVTTAPAAPVPAVYAPSPMPATPYAPSNIDISKGILQVESGNNPHVRTSPQGAVGQGQIMPATAKPYMLPGENLNNPHDNLAIHNRIMDDYKRRWPGDPARQAVAYFSGPGNVAPPGSATPWKRNVSDVNESVSKYVADAMHAAGGKGGSPLPSSTVAAAPATAPSVGNALASLTKSNSEGKSPLGDAQSAFGGGQQQQQQASQGDLGAQQAAAGGGMQRQAQIAQQAAQLAAALKIQQRAAAVVQLSSTWCDGRFAESGGPAAAIWRR